MKDLHDKQTRPLLGVSGVQYPASQGRGTAPVMPRQPKPFNAMQAVTDLETFGALKPKSAKLLQSGNSAFAAYFVPVAFVAKDWNVTPRRIRALLTAGRLAGQLQDNGYWEVRFPYLFTFGTRGPSLKRQQRPEKRPKKPELRAV